MNEVYFNLTNPQKNIWNLEQYYNNSNINNICTEIIFNQELDIKYLKEAIKIAIEKNDNFYLSFKLINNIPKQYFKNKIDYNIDNYIINSDDELIKIEKEMSSIKYDLNNDDHLFKVITFQMKKENTGIIFSAHHLISDSWGMGVLCSQISYYYNKLINNEKIYFNNYSYGELIKREESYNISKTIENDKIYWNKLFENIPEPLTIPSVKEYENVSENVAKRLNCTINKINVNKIKEYCNKNKISLYNFFMAIYSVYINAITNSNDFVIGTPILNRVNYKEKNIVGMFVSTALFRIKINNSKFIELLKQISVDTLGLLRHQRYSYQQLLTDLREKNSNVPNLYKIMLSYQITKPDNSYLQGTSKWIFNGNSADDLQIHIDDYNDSGIINISYDFKVSKYSKNYIYEIHKRILNIINQILEKNDIKIDEIEVVTKEEKMKILNEFNNTKFDYQKNKTIVDLFEEQAKINPNKTALICKGKKLSYDELNKRANNLAHYLRENNINNNDVIGIMLHRSVELIIGLLAIAKCGATYLPLDPEYPIERIMYILKDSKCKILLTDSQTTNIINDNSYRKLNIELNSEIYSNKKNENLNINISPESLIYLIYTSGSTGAPKGVMIKHQNLTNFIFAEKRLIDFNSEKVMVSVTTVCFDIFGLELWCTLSSGMKLVLADDKEQNSQELLSKLCIENNVNMIQTTPSRFAILMSEEDNVSYFKKITEIMIGGEELPQKILNKMHSLTNAKIYNMYGPTETTIWSTIKDLSTTDNITIGKPIGNTTCYILNKNKKLMPINTPGELYIGGDGVTKGYLNRKELTDEKFVKSPFNENELIYNTNDLAYFKEDGEIVHLGRTDFQIKLNGYRIDLNEIQNKILQLKDIKTAIIIPRNNKILVCYYISEKEYSREEFSDYLLKYLPNYMIPSYYIKLNYIPLTPNGKLNRLELNKIELKEEKFESPSTQNEKILAKLISDEIDNSDNILDINTSFRELGLDSLSIIQIQTSLLKYDITLTTQDFYRYPTIKSLGLAIEKKQEKDSENNLEIPKEFKHSNENLGFNLQDFNKDEDILNNVLLTGANGFVGIHVLYELLKTTNNKVYCVVREKENIKPYERMKNIFKFYFNENIDDYINKNRIEVVDGNITEKNFGLSENELERLNNKFLTIIHTAADVKHYGKYDEFEKININATKNIADYAFENKKRLIHISSISVSGNYLVRQDNRDVEFSENDLYIGQHYKENVYVNSKIIAESMILSYMKKGLIAQIHRLGILSGRYNDGVFQKKIEQNAFYNRFKSMIKIGAVSKDMLEQKIEFTPVDYCAKCIVGLAKNSSCNNKIFNLYNYNLITINEIINSLKKFKINIKVLNKKEFNDYLHELSNNNSKFLNSIVNDIYFDKNNNQLSLNYNFTVKIKSNYTKEYLSKLNIDWPKIDQEYINKIVSYMKKVNFI